MTSLPGQLFHQSTLTTMMVLKRLSYRFASVTTSRLATLPLILSPRGPLFAKTLGLKRSTRNDPLVLVAAACRSHLVAAPPSTPNDPISCILTGAVEPTTPSTRSGLPCGTPHWWIFPTQGSCLPINTCPQICWLFPHVNLLQPCGRSVVYPHNLPSHLLGYRCV